MPGKPVTDQQVRVYMQDRHRHSQRVAAARAGFSERTGCTSPNMTEAATNRALIAAAGKTVVVADHTKLRLVGLATIVGLDDVDVLVSDSGLSPEDQAMLAGHVGRLLVAELPGTDGRPGTTDRAPTRREEPTG